MSQSNEGCLGPVVIIGTSIISIYSGIMAWNWVKPESFGGAIIFLIAWSILSYIGHLIVGAIAVVVFGK